MSIKYLMKGTAALFMGFAAAACSHDFSVEEQATQQSIDNAQATLGFYIPEDQDWVMTKDITATIGVNLSLDQNYTVAVYDQNPLFNSEAVYYGQAQVSEGGRVNLDLTVPSYMTGFYVAAYDSKFRPVVQYATLQDGVLKADLGDDASTARTRATEAEFPSYSMTAQEALGGSLTVAAMENYYELTDDVIANETNDGCTLQNGKWGWDDNKNASVQLPVGTDSRHFKVPSGATITKKFHSNANDENQQPVVDGAVIYVRGTLNVKSNYTLNSTSIIVGDGGKVIFDGTINMTNGSRLIVLGNGSVTATDGSTITVTNAGACYNAGTIEFKGTLNANGSQFYNCGTVKVNQLLNAAGTGVITNFGKIDIVSNGDASDAYNCRLINACYYHASEHAGFGQITMLRNSRIDVDGYAEFAQSWQTLDVELTDKDGSNIKNATITYPNTMMDKSVINVGTAFCTNTVFQGPTASGEIAIVKLGKVQLGNGTDISQRNNCYFDWDIAEVYTKDPGKGVTTSKIALSNPEAINQYVKTHITKFITEATSPVSIPAGDCTGSGYNPGGGGGGGVGGSKPTYTYAFEDNRTRCDFDLNDVVIWVKENEANSDKIDITLVAAGCQYDNYVFLGDTRIEWARGAEVHDALGVAHGVMFNTQSTSVSSSSFVTTTIDKPAGFNIEMADFKIKPYAKGSDPDVDEPYETIGISALEYLQTRHTIAPLGLVFPCKWQWPTERTIVSMAYEGFDQWGSAPKADVKIDALEWYKSSNAISGKVVLTN